MRFTQNNVTKMTWNDDLKHDLKWHHNLPYMRFGQEKFTEIDRNCPKIMHIMMLVVEMVVMMLVGVGGDDLKITL